MRKLVQEQNSISFDKFDKQKPKMNDLFSPDGSHSNHRKHQAIPQPQFYLKPATVIFDGILPKTVTIPSASEATMIISSKTNTNSANTNTNNNSSPPDSPPSSAVEGKRRSRPNNRKGASGTSSAIFTSAPYLDSDGHVDRKKLERRNTFDHDLKAMKVVSPRRYAFYYF
jgi:hypothetical protein